MATSLQDLLADRTVTEEEQTLLSVFQALGFAVSDWNVGGVARTMVKAISTALFDHYGLIQTITRGRLVELARQMVDSTGKPVLVWLTALAENFYQLTRSPATFTVERCTLASDPGSGAINVQPGFIARAPGTGNRYVYQGAAPVSVPDGGHVSIDLTAENAGSKYADPANTITDIITSIPGLSINNPGTSFGGIDASSAARKSASSEGTGTVTPSGAPALTRSYLITVLASGTPGSSGQVRLQYLDNGTLVTVAEPSPIPTTSTALGDGITLTFAQPVGTAGFLVGDQHTFETPGSPIIQQGVDTETNDALAARMRGRWPDLSVNFTQDKYRAMVAQASIDGGYGISKITIQASNTEAGVANVLLATAAGSPSTPTITAIQSYINARSGVLDKANVAGASNHNVTLGGSATVKADVAEAVKDAADANWSGYLAQLDIGGDTSTGSPGLVRLSKLAEAVMDAGAIDVSGLTLDGVGANLALGESEVAVIVAGQLPSEALTWNVVP